MSHHLDPAPRNYPQFVHLLRRGQFDAATLGALTVADIEGWLLAEAADETDLMELFQAFAWRLVVAGLPLDRVSLSVGTLHPQMFGYAWNWETGDGYCDEVRVEEEVLQTDAYRRNPIYGVLERGELFRSRVDDPEIADGSPLLAQLALQGMTEYAGIPLRAVGQHHNAVSVATKQTDGFTEEQFSTIHDLLKLFALHVQRHTAARISENLVTTYLGAATGGQVLSGSIKRGAGASIDAVIWASDLRGFTDLADRLDDGDMTAVLNAYFERLAGAVLDHGGEVLKFIGDGLLAAFPFAAFETEAAAARAAFDAARSALAALERLNGDKTELSDIAGWRPLRSGIALHRGEVFFGNVGAARRLDFTVIGAAVNATSRVEGLTKELGRPILITAPVADVLDWPLDDMGEHDLRGLSEPVSIFAPAAD